MKTGLEIVKELARRTKAKGLLPNDSNLINTLREMTAQEVAKLIIQAEQKGTK